MQMSFSSILETLKHSVNYEEFQITYNELVPEIVKAKNISFSNWKQFMKEKNILKKIFYDNHCKECPDIVIRKLSEAKHIYDIDISEYISELEKKLNPILKFKMRLEKLK